MRTRGHRWLSRTSSTMRSPELGSRSSRGSGTSATSKIRSDSTRRCETSTYLSRAADYVQVVIPVRARGRATRAWAIILREQRGIAAVATLSGGPPKAGEQHADRAVGQQRGWLKELDGEPDLIAAIAAVRMSLSRWTSEFSR